MRGSENMIRYLIYFGGRTDKTCYGLGRNREKEESRMILKLLTRAIGND